MVGGNPFDAFQGVFGNSSLSKPSENKPEKGLPWNAKEWNGKLYLPLEQVIELLKQNDVLPAVRAGLEKHIKKEN